MYRIFRTTCLVLTLLCLVPIAAMANTYQFTPPVADLYDLDHSYFYTWGLNWSVPGGEAVTSVSLFFDDIRNWKVEPNQLYIHLLDSAQLGVKKFYDGQGGGDSFAGQGVLLIDPYVSFGATSVDFNYDFTQDQVQTFVTYLATPGALGYGNVGFGFDPDCHYYNNGIRLTVNTTHVPEPSSLILLGTGLFGFALFGRRLQK